MKNIKIATQLKIGITAMMLFVLVLGFVSYLQSNAIHHQTEIMYDHPLLVRRAIGALYADIYAIQSDMKDLLLAADKDETAYDIDRIETTRADAFAKIDIIYSKYLGPRSDVDALKHEFIKFNTFNDETIRLLRTGNLQEALIRTKNTGIGIKHVSDMLIALQKIDGFAEKKGDQLYKSSKTLADTLNIQLALCVALIILFSFFINYILLRNIRNPLAALTHATDQFHQGDMTARCLYSFNNEFGVLSESFNTMAAGFQLKKDLDEKSAALAALMSSEYDAEKFFKATLNALAVYTGSQMSAVYLLSKDRKTFEHFESVGVDDNARQSFAADRFEGEFGAALSQRKVQHIENIPHDTRFVFPTVSGKFIPREIITIPILADNEVVAIISLASVNAYTEQSLHVIDAITVTLCARVEGILAYLKIKEYSATLEAQYAELEVQKNEMAAQSAELLRQNIELDMQKKQLDEVSRLKTSFLSNMSHELRTPLNSVIALSGVLNRRLAKKIPDEEYSYIDVIERNGRHLLELINDILDISRIEAGREEIEISSFNINSVIDEIISMINPQAVQKNIAVIHSAADTEMRIVSDPAKCRHVLQNLISNAVKFTEKGNVTVSLYAAGENITVTVADTGIGISEKHLPHIFDEFRQADGSTSRRYGGTGLGLAIAKKYAHILGGSISVKSAEGKGSEFILTLPVRYAAENRSIGKEYTADVSSLPQHPRATASADTVKTILLVEDSEPAIIQIKDFLEESGYRILLARDGAQALGIIAHTIPDAMILDLMMPGIDGFDVLKTLRNAEPTAHIPVLILTAKHITKDELTFLKRNNVHQLIQKGDVNRSELLRAIAAMVHPRIEIIAAPQKVLPAIEGKPFVLVVEDNPDNMLTVKALLAQEYRVLEAVNGIECIEKARTYMPDLILMDIALPGMDGIEAFKTIRRDAHMQKIPVIALTASAMTSDRETILAHGFDSYISKPIDAAVFFKTIKETLYGK